MHYVCVTQFVRHLRRARRWNKEPNDNKNNGEQALKTKQDDDVTVTEK